MELKSLQFPLFLQLKLSRMTFLNELTNYILRNQDIDLLETAIILPNKRSNRLLLKSLAKEIGKPFFSPTLFDINSFIESLSSRKKLSNSELLIRLYRSYLDLNTGKESQFHSFLSWGNVFLRDINDIDMQLADAKQIFQNLKESKELETSFGKEKLTPNQENYIRFYAGLADLYLQFNQKLEEEATAYEGGIYKEVAMNIDNYATKHAYKRFIFAGLSILSPAEINIIRYFKEHYPCEFYFDLDSFYINALPKINDLNEKLNLPALHHIRNDYASIPKTITEVGAAGKMSQIIYAIDKINKIKEEQGNLDNTMLLLADESLLLPFVNIYDAQNVNYTMGYPVAALPVYSLLKILIQLAKNSLRFQEIENQGEGLLYHKDIIAFFQHPLIRERFPSAKEHASFMKKIINQNKIFFTFREIPHFSETIVLPDLMSKEMPLLQNLTLFFKNLLIDLNPNESSFADIELIISGLSDIGEILESKEAEIIHKHDIKTIEYLIQDTFSTMTIPFKGDSDQGLQVMGLLETRGLDFKNVIILSVNEGILPAGRSQSSLILFDIKQAFGLPDHRQKESVASYHFFRLLQRAEEIFLIYNTNSTDNILAEKSRFISQLEYEIKNQHLEDHILLKSENFSLLPEKKQTEPPIVIRKTPEMMEKLYAKEYSPSALSLYVRCPLRFYLSAIERIEPPESIEERIEQKVIGTILHDILEDIFQKVKEEPSKKITILEEELAEIDAKIRKEFSKNRETQGLDYSKGKLFLAYEIIKKNLIDFLKLSIEEFADNEITILEVEEKLCSTITIAEKSITIKGRVDRIDLRDGNVTIFDYKTGRMLEKELKYQTMEDVFHKPEMSKLFQLLMYAYLYRKDEKTASVSEQQIRCGIISFSGLSRLDGNTFYYPLLPDEQGKATEFVTPSLLEEFEKELISMIEKILNSDLPFCQTDQYEHCRFCDYLALCGRE